MQSTTVQVKRNAQIAQNTQKRKQPELVKVKHTGTEILHMMQSDIVHAQENPIHNRTLEMIERKKGEHVTKEQLKMQN